MTVRSLPQLMLQRNRRSLRRTDNPPGTNLVPAGTRPGYPARAPGGRGGQRGRHAMGLIDLIIILVIGGVAGWLAGLIVKGFGFGLIGNIVVGIVGAIIAGFLLPRLGIIIGGGVIAAIINAVIGAVILLLIIGVFKKAT
jgi:uncharacterized membrane protein YeaQ/YmgE (transglycosylase-associated protein family)